MRACYGIVVHHDSISLQELALELELVLVCVTHSKHVQYLRHAVHKVRELHDVILDQRVVGVVAGPVRILDARVIKLPEVLLRDIKLGIFCRSLMVDAIKVAAD